MEEGDRVAAMEGAAVPRVRFVALRGPEPATLLRFHPRLTVLSGFGDDVGPWLAHVLTRGPEATPDGFAEIGGTRVHLAELPATVFAHGTCPLLTPDALEGDAQHLGGDE